MDGLSDLSISSSGMWSIASGGNEISSWTRWHDLEADRVMRGWLSEYLKMELDGRYPSGTPTGG